LAVQIADGLATARDGVGRDCASQQPHSPFHALRDHRGRTKTRPVFLAPPKRPAMVPF
jgi:hypothetical protein